MVCEETKSGDVHCVLPEKHQGIVYKVDQFAGNDDVLDDYMAELFAETCVFKFSGMT